ncbi:MAG: DUF1266 domain-containing protein [Actinophytocola sp.]|uniref:DUF1266 domain-containing protein n=1 Tax=Actinophytocola sp. TaxID=1872138 RepID=UPI003C76A1E0
MVVCDHVEGVVSSPQGPFYGALAHGYACGAHTPVHVSRPWNALDDPVHDYTGNRESLADSWGVTTEEDWSRQVEYLLGGMNVGPEVDVVLNVRRMVLRQQGHYDLPTWQNAVRKWARWQLRKEPAEVDEMVHLAGVVTRYESRFRTDGLLPHDGIVTSVFGYDFGRAVNMARWGFGGRFCDYPTAERIVLRAGELCRQHYTSWADFSAGYALGSVIRFDEEKYGHLYAAVRGPHRLLVADRTSPWWHVPFA